MGGFPKVLGAPILRILTSWGLYLFPPIYGHYHFVTTREACWGCRAYKQQLSSSRVMHGSRAMGEHGDTCTLAVETSMSPLSNTPEVSTVPWSAFCKYRAERAVEAMARNRMAFTIESIVI